MNNPARSVFVFGLYLALTGLTLVIVPNLLLNLVGLPTSTEVWPRVVGILTVALSFFFTQAARKGLTDFFRWTVYVRLSVFVGFTLLALLGFAGPALILFGVFDLLGALWTAWALRAVKAW